jgi:hypothetical protein
MNYKLLLLYLTIILLITISIYFFIETTSNKIKYKQIIVLDNEIDINNRFKYERTVYELVKRDTLRLPNENNTLIISWRMFIPSFTGSNYWSNYYGNDKHIISIGDSPKIMYNPKNNKLKVMCEYLSSPFYNHYPILEFQNIELQKWNTFTIKINSYHIILYYNGNMVLNRKYNNLLKIDDHKTKFVKIGKINNNIYGKLDNVIFNVTDMSHYNLSKLNT